MGITVKDFLKSERALPEFIRLLSHEDRWLRFKAAPAIKNIGGEATPAVPDILKAVVQTAEPLQPINWDDSIQLTHAQLAAALFEGGLRGRRHLRANAGWPRQRKPDWTNHAADRKLWLGCP